MESFEDKIKLHNDLQKFQIEKSIIGTEAFYIDQDLMKGVSQEEILEKARSGIYKPTKENLRRGLTGQKYGKPVRSDEEKELESNYSNDEMIKLVQNKTPNSNLLENMTKKELNFCWNHALANRNSRNSAIAKQADSWYSAINSEQSRRSRNKKKIDIIMESFEQKIKERNNLLKSQVESLTGRNELVEVIDTLLKAGVAEEDLVEKAKYIRREADGKGGYKYIYSEPKEKQSKEFTTEDIKNMSSKEKIDLALRGNAAAQRALDYGEYQHFLHLSQKENKIKTDKVDKKEDKSNIEKLSDIKGEGIYILPSGSKLKIYKEGDLYRADYKYPNKNSEFWGFAKDGEEKFFKTKDLKELIREIENTFKKSSESDLEKAKADKKQQKKISKVMKEFKAGTLKTSAGKPVTDQKMAIAIAMSEAGMSVKKSTLSTVLKQNESDIEKGKSFPIGTIHNGFKKVAEGKWRKVSESGMTKEEHHKEADIDEETDKKYYHGSEFGSNKRISSELKESTKRHREIASKLDDKHYSDEEVGIKKSENGDIEKSHFGKFSYSEKLGIKKTGKEIKEKFKANLQKEQSEANELKAKLGVLKTKIGEEPTKKCDYWQIDVYEDKGIDIPLVYDYSQMKGEEKMSPIAETLVVETESQPKENITNLMYKYNEIVRKYIDSQKEILQINTILNNYKDTDVYQLTISQATVLGF